MSEISPYFFFSQSYTVSSGSGNEVFTRITSYCLNLGPTLFLLYINDLSDDVTSNIAICADDAAFYSKCDQASDLWQQLEMAAVLESVL